MNKNALCYFKSAQELFLSPVWHNEIDGFEFYLGKKKFYIRGAVTPFNHSSSSYICKNKYCMNTFLAAHNFPVAKCDTLSKSDLEQKNVESKLQHLTFPIVLKPVNGTLGDGVLCGIQNFKQAYEYLENNAFDRSDFILAEEFHGGLKSYRVLIYEGKILGVIERYPAKVIADGKNNIKQLIEIENIKRQSICDTLADILIDQECLICLNEQNLSIKDIPTKGKTIRLAYTCNATRGGTYQAIDKNKICAENKKLLIQAADTLLLNIAGFDVECSDISKPIEDGNGIIVEANPGPSIRIHENPIKGKPSAVTKKVMMKFISHHPLSYLFQLYKNPKTSIYIKSIIVIIIMSLVKLLIMNN